MPSLFALCPVFKCCRLPGLGMLTVCLALSVLSAVATPSAPAVAVAAADGAVRSRQAGRWSEAATWEGGRVPAAGAVVLVRPGHRVLYDVENSAVLRAVHIGGTLSFSRDRDTLLNAGLIRIAPGEECPEEGFDCHAIAMPPGPSGSASGTAANPEAEAGAERGLLEVGTADSPIPAGHKAVLRLSYIEGMDRQSFPALVACRGRMELHGADIGHSWVKLREHACPRSPELYLAEPVPGWRVGDHLLIPTTESSEFYTQDASGRRVIGSVLDETQTEEGEIAAISGNVITLREPVKFRHQAEGKFCGEVANLSRNVIVESADPGGERGHTMYHRDSAGSISWAEFRHLGKQGVLGRYPIHFHECGGSMRGASVIGASIWDSHNRWLTIHGTDYLVVRDCVGFRGIGHGFFFEDGTEVFNVMDRNLGVQALMGKPLPAQMLPFDTNDGAGFWWANCQNSLTRNVAVECDKFGYRFQMTKTETFDPRLLIRQADGGKKSVDVRTLPFIRFEGNEAHSQRRFAFNLGGFHGQSSTEDLDRDGNVLDRGAYLGGDVLGVGPDARHPFRIRDLLVWKSHWGFHTTAPNVEIDGFTAHDVNYVVWRSNIAGHNYNRLQFDNIHVSTFFNNWGIGGTRADLLRYTDPQDTQPPVTVITRVEWAADNLVKVSGVTADDSAIREVLVNGQAAMLQPGPVTDWTAFLPVATAAGGRVEISASALDAAGNQEITAHRLTALRGSGAVSSSTSLLPASAAPPAPASVAAPASAEPGDAVPAAAENIRETKVNPAALKWPLWDGKETSAAYAARLGLAAKRAVSLNGEPLDLVLVPAGSFLMGSPPDEPGRSADEGPQHRVVISAPFYLGQCELTQAQYQQVTGGNPAYFKGPARPVEQVSWDEVQVFLQKAGHSLRLPTEAEWEFACRAGTTTAFYTGSSPADADRAAWHGYDDENDRAESNGETQPVGGKLPNAFGLFDMHGNVYEWCADVYSPKDYRTSGVFDPAGPADGDERVLRGGSWEARAASARSANRNGFSPHSRGYAVGFRVAQPVVSPE